MHLPTKVNSWFVTTYLVIKHNSDSDAFLYKQLALVKAIPSVVCQ